MNRSFLAYVLTGLVAVALGFGCSGGDEELPATSDTSASTQAAKPKPATPAPTPSEIPAPSAVPAEEVAASVAKQLRETVDMPEYFPADGPVYPGAKPSQVQQLPNGRVSVVFGTDASVDEAAKVMSEASEAKGWTINSEDVIERGFLARATKDGRNLMILTNRVSDSGADAMTLVAISIDP